MSSIIIKSGTDLNVLLKRFEYYINIKGFIQLLARIADIYKQSFLEWDKEMDIYYDPIESEIYVKHISIWILFNKTVKVQDGYKMKYVSVSQQYFVDNFIKWTHEYLDCNGISS